MGFLDPDEVIQEALDLSSALQTVGSMVTKDMVQYTKDAASKFYGAYSPQRYSRMGDLSDVGEPDGPTMQGKYSVRCGAKALEGNVSSKPAYQWGKNAMSSSAIISGTEIFNTAWMGGMHGAWYVAATTQSPQSMMQNYMAIEYGKIGGYLSALLG